MTSLWVKGIWRCACAVFSQGKISNKGEKQKRILIWRLVLDLVLLVLVAGVMMQIHLTNRQVPASMRERERSQMFSEGCSSHLRFNYLSCLSLSFTALQGIPFLMPALQAKRDQSGQIRSDLPLSLLPHLFCEDKEQ